MNKEILLRVENLTKIFTLGSVFSRVRIRTVNNVSFNIDKSEIFTLAGESGSGKTTVAKIILGFLEPTSGKIIYKGKDMIEGQKEDKKSIRKEVQAVFQNPFETFNPLRMVHNYLIETAKNLGVNNNYQEVIENAINLVGLTWNDVVNKYPSEFSGGQLQRISIARSLLTNPTLLVADEPVSMVDASLRMSIVNLFAKLKKEIGLSVLYITHDLATAYYVSDRIAIMFRGEIVEMGSVDKVLTDPKHPYTMLLKESIPEPDPKKKWTKDIKILTLEEEEYQMKGCKFISRCPYRMDKCKNPVPDVEVDGRVVKCYLYI